eukprot:2609340-Pyramimonas_sp.AAC.1
MPRAERIRASTYPRDRAPESRPRRAWTWMSSAVSLKDVRVSKCPLHHDFVMAFRPTSRSAGAR